MSTECLPIIASITGAKHLQRCGPWGHAPTATAWPWNATSVPPWRGGEALNPHRTAGVATADAAAAHIGNDRSTSSAPTRSAARYLEIFDAQERPNAVRFVFLDPRVRARAFYLE
jgi:hypothetical protein